MCPSCVASAFTAGSFVALYGSGHLVQWLQERRRARAMQRILSLDPEEASDPEGDERRIAAVDTAMTKLG